KQIKPRYMGPFVVICRNHNGAYILAELDGSISKLPYAAFPLIPYYPLSLSHFHYNPRRCHRNRS
ncbi:hypothetical protein K439DRAFT_1362027, partial [Ramaria rubella]